jgi:hypothetical protein
LVPDEFEFGDEFASLRCLRGIAVHGVDQGADVAAFGFGTRESALSVPGIPIGAKERGGLVRNSDVKCRDQ